MKNQEMKTLLNMIAEHKPWNECAAFAHECGEDWSPDYIRQGSRMLLAATDAGFEIADKVHDLSVAEIADKAPVNRELKENGSMTMDRLVALYEGHTNLSEAEMMDFFHLPVSDWHITSCKLQAWHGATSGDSGTGKQILYNLRINVEPKSSKNFGPADIEDLMKRLQVKSIALPAVPTYKRSKKKVVRTLEIDLADVHFGLLAWKPETGENYDLHIAQQYVLSAAAKIVQRYAGRDIDVVNIVSLGDILHVDNCNLTTAHGTKQDCEGRVPKMMDTAIETVCAFIRTIEAGLQVPVRYIYVPGNHDETIGYALAKVIEMAFVMDKNVTCDVSPSTFKCINYGATAVMVCHGEANSKRLGNAMMSKFRSEFGNSIEAEAHCGHLHSVDIDTQTPVSIIRVNAVTEPSYWENSMAFAHHERGMTTFLYESDVPGFIELGAVING